MTRVTGSAPPLNTPTPAFFTIESLTVIAGFATLSVTPFRSMTRRDGFSRLNALYVTSPSAASCTASVAPLPDVVTDLRVLARSAGVSAGWLGGVSPPGTRDASPPAAGTAALPG